MFDGKSVFLIFLAVWFVVVIAMRAYFDWASKHMDKAPEWVRSSIERQKSRKNKVF